MIEKYINTLDTSKAALVRSLSAIQKRAKRKTDICDHLETIFFECLGIRSRLIVELGSGDGESTFVLERIAKLWKAKLVSVDIEDREEVSFYQDRIFVLEDDITFVGKFRNWCGQHHIEPKIDILFIDTSHLFDHTVQEINAWFPFLAPRSKVLFHDTNLKEIFLRKDGSTGQGWNNERGVIRAIEKYFSRPFKEDENFITIIDGWQIRHIAHCNGLMIMDRYDK
ncbi:MAG: class I SAM-dependent methyltransferase [Syntrophales bacterium]|nr:class I SAM-dependent methyltransferase [Syntrophales bacterium]